MRLDFAGGHDVIKLQTERAAIPAAVNPQDGLVDFVPGAAGIEPGFPICTRVALAGVDLTASSWWIFPADGVWRITAALTRGDATAGTFLHHQLRFFRFSAAMIYAAAAYDSCAEPQPDPGGVISGFTPPIVWTGFATRSDAVGQYLEHDSPTPIDAAGSLTIEYLGHNGDPSTALGDGTVAQRPGPWGNRLGATLPGPGPSVVDYGPDT